MNNFKTVVIVLVLFLGLGVAFYTIMQSGSNAGKRTQKPQEVIEVVINDNDINLAESGDSNAQQKVGRAYYYGQNGLEKNHVKGMEYLEKSSMQGNALALYELGIIYYNGIEVEQDYVKAFNYFMQSGEKGNSDALYNVAVMHEFGYGVDVNLNEAAKIYKSLADDDYLDAIISIAIMYELGEGVEQDYKLAAKYYEKSLKQHSDVGQYSLGYLYEKGLGVKQDTKKAMEYFVQAAEQGNVDAIYSLAIIHYNNGERVEAEYVKAFGYAWVAVSLNDKDNNYINAFNTMNDILPDNIREQGELFGFNLLKIINTNNTFK